MRHNVASVASCDTGTAPIRILIVEDEFLVAVQLEDILADEGYSVIGTVTDRDSLRSIQGPPDIALVDLNLRDGLTGLSIAQELAQKYETKVVYVTANPDQIDKPAGTAVGVLPKPFSRSAVLDAVLFAMQDNGSMTPPRDLRQLAN